MRVPFVPHLFYISIIFGFHSLLYGILPDKYHLQGMPTASYPKRTEKNILDSGGNIIFSRGVLTGGSAFTRKLGKQHNKPWTHVDLPLENSSSINHMISLCKLTKTPRKKQGEVVPEVTFSSRFFGRQVTSRMYS